MKKKVLILAGYYTPGIKAGGPIQSIKNLVDNLSDRVDFKIVALDRDKGDESPYPNIITDKWVEVGNAQVYYVNQATLNWGRIRQLINEADHDILYLNSFFDYKLSIIPIILRKINLIRPKLTILAPRGNFSIGALGLKSKKKNLLIKVSKILNLHNDVVWHATAQEEQKDIELIFGGKENIRVANNLTANYSELEYEKAIKKNNGELSIVFISRIHPKKNLLKAIEYLNHINGTVYFNIYGPIEDKEYWAKCNEKIGELPKNITVSYKGPIDHDKVIEIFKKHHVFLFPTLGENYGHVISEALIGGSPVIISDQTPWRELETFQVGWDIKLNDEEKFIEVLQRCVNLTQYEYELLSRQSFKYGKETANNEKGKEYTFKLFEDL
ncbi:glycosyltransferase [Solibacillus isronensis]|uniref:glycosyltransferase n=1 Tax=Solibacillus isronensis TaxID=412383 RepID=UPI00203B9452|nr:glycosyltransferase [Solibacillus isronensis]MCM3722105.1 glycosyltransferase [Solibacillus isronensis]